METIEKSLILTILLVITSVAAYLYYRKSKKLKRRWLLLNLTLTNNVTKNQSVSEEIFCILNKMSRKELSLIHVDLIRFFKLYLTDIYGINKLLELFIVLTKKESKGLYFRDTFIGLISSLTIEKLAEIYASTFTCDKIENGFFPYQRERDIILCKARGMSKQKQEEFFTEVSIAINLYIRKFDQSDVIRDMYIGEIARIRVIIRGEKNNN